MEGSCIIQNKKAMSLSSFISTNVMDGEVSVEYDDVYKMETISNHHISSLRNIILKKSSLIYYELETSSNHYIYS